MLKIAQDFIAQGNVMDSGVGIHQSVPHSGSELAGQLAHLIQPFIGRGALGALISSACMSCCPAIVPQTPG